MSTLIHGVNNNHPMSADIKIKCDNKNLQHLGDSVSIDFSSGKIIEVSKKQNASWPKIVLSWESKVKVKASAHQFCVLEYCHFSQPPSACTNSWPPVFGKYYCMIINPDTNPPQNTFSLNFEVDPDQGINISKRALSFKKSLCKIHWCADPCCSTVTIGQPPPGNPCP